MLRLLITLIFLGSLCAGFTQIHIEYNAEVMPKRLIVKCRNLKINRNTQPEVSTQLAELLKFIKAQKITQKYANATPAYNSAEVDIRSIYEIEYAAPYPVQQVAEFFKSLPDVEYAHPHFIMHHFGSANDPTVPQQYYLQTIRSFDAWDIETGDSSIVIGIVDSGVDMSHDDLIDQIAYNQNDPINGKDDDNDGYIDNFKGWDLAENDNNPTTDYEDHGTTVAGPAIAKTNNGKCMAGIAHDCRFLPIKQTDSMGALTCGYEALVYAADHGCKIINCSWGSTYSAPEYQDIVKYANDRKSSLVIAAAGNTNDYSIFFPASYSQVMSVAGTTAKDERWSPLNSPTRGGSSFNYYVDISAPAASIKTIAKPNADGYVYGGTSIATPMVSACAALVASNRPWLRMEQVRAQLEVTAHNIDTIAFNQSTAQMMGRGRVDAYKALKDTLIPAIRFENVSFSDGADNRFLPGRTITISGRFRNLLHHSGRCVIQLRPISSFMNIVNGTYIVDTLARDATISNEGKEFTFTINSATPLYYTLYFKLLYKYASHTEEQIFSLKLNNQYINIASKTLTASMSATGRLGMVTADGEGEGFKRFGKTTVKVAGLMLAESADSVASCLVGTQDFMPLQIARSEEANNPFSLNYTSLFNDNFDTQNRMNLQIRHQAGVVESIDAIVTRYTIKNISSQDLKHFIVGQIVDWDIEKPWCNKIAYDAHTQMAYAWSPTNTNLFGGMICLEGNLLTHHALDYYPSDSTINLSGDYTDAERYQTLTTWHNTAGDNSTIGSSVMDCMSSGPYNLQQSDSLSVSFAIFMANSIDSLRIIAKALRNAVNQNHNTTPLLDNDAISVKLSQNSTDVDLTITGNQYGKFLIEIFANDGRLVGQQCFDKQDFSQTQKIPLLTSKSMYFIKLNGSNISKTLKLITN